VIRHLLAIVCVLGLLLGGASSAFAAGGGAATTREVIINETVITPGELNPCTGGTGTLIRTFNGFVQRTTRPDGSFHWNGRLTASDARFIPDNPAEPTFTGREQVHISTNTNAGAETLSFSVRVWLVGPDGSTPRGHFTDHLTINPDGKVVEFHKLVIIGCP
jgi:phosphate-selective porin